MGWSGGTEVAGVLIELCNKYVPRASQSAFLKRAFTCLENLDWDCQGDIMSGSRPIDKLVRKVMHKMHPSWRHDEDEYDPEDDRDDS